MSTVPFKPRVARPLLLIEDNEDISRMIALNLEAEGFAVTRAMDGETGLAELDRARPELVVLDLMLPGIDGLQVCRSLRARPEYVPIIILSAKSTESHRVLGLELGADDYLTKPFSMPELCARVHAVLRRMDAAEQRAQQIAGVIKRGALTVDPVARAVLLDGRDVVLTSKEFDLLAHFARHPGRVFTRMQLLDQVWGYQHQGYEHTVNAHINRLRMKIEAQPAKPLWIQTVWGVGYKFIEPDAAP